MTIFVASVFVFLIAWAVISIPNEDEDIVRARKEYGKVRI